MRIIKLSTFQISQIHVSQSLPLTGQHTWGLPVYTYVCGGQDLHRIRKDEVAFSEWGGKREREIKSIRGKKKENRKLKINLKCVFSKRPGLRA